MASREALAVLALAVLFTVLAVAVRCLRCWRCCSSCLQWLAMLLTCLSRQVSRQSLSQELLPDQAIRGLDQEYLTTENKGMIVIPLATAPPGQFQIFIVDGPSQKLMFTATVSMLEDGDPSKRYQTYDIFKVLFIRNVTSKADAHQTTYASLRPKDLVCVVDGRHRPWNTIVAGDAGIENGCVVSIWPKAQWMQKNNLCFLD